MRPAATRTAVPLRLKPRIGAVDDPLEREADHVADAVVNGASLPAIHPSSPHTGYRKCAECESDNSEELRAKPVAGSLRASQVEAAATAVATGGERMPGRLRSYFEPRFRRDFSLVRLHQGRDAMQAARSIDARAYTLGQDIAFAPGEYSPDTREGRRLLAHELAHVAQNDGGGTELVQRAEVKVGDLTIQVDYSGLTSTPAAGMAAKTTAQITAYMGAAPSPATQATIGGLSDTAKTWLMFGLDLLSDNTAAAHAALDRGKAVDRLVAAAPTALQKPLPDPDNRFVHEVLEIAGWFEIALTASLSKPTGADATAIDKTVNPPPTVGSVGDPLDVPNFKARLKPALKHLLNKVDPAAWSSKGTRSLPAFQILGDKIMDEARGFFSPFADAARGNLFSLSPPWHASANIFDVGSTVPTTDDRINYLENRAEIVGWNSDKSDSRFSDANIFAETKFDGTRAADTGELLGVVTDLESNPAVQAQVDRLIQHTGQQSGSGTSTKIGLVTEFDAGAKTACQDHWKGIQTLCHEVLHALSHPDFEAASSRVKFPQVVREGFTEVLGVQLFNDRVKPKAKSEPAFKTALEAGVAGAPCPEPPVSTVGYGDAGKGAKSILDKVKDKNFRAAYFLGRPDLAGIP